MVSPIGNVTVAKPIMLFLRTRRPATSCKRSPLMGTLPAAVVAGRHHLGRTNAYVPPRGLRRELIPGYLWGAFHGEKKVLPSFGPPARLAGRAVVVAEVAVRH